VDQLLADEQVDWSDADADGETLWALADHLGSIRDVVDSYGDARIYRRFDAFGKIVDETHYDTSGLLVIAGQAGFVDTAFGYTGKLFDDATRLQNHLNRWYDAGVGRWLSEDPIGFDAGDANLYRYVGNSPTMHTDPTGEIPPLILIGIGVGAFFGAMSSANVANAPGPGDPVFPDPGAGGGEPQNVLIGAVIGGGVGTGVHGLKVIIGGSGAAATTYPSIQIGGATAEKIVMQNGVLSMRIALTRKLPRDFVIAIKDLVRTSGARCVEIDTGLVINPNLAAHLSAAAASGAPYYGGTVVQVAGGPLPIFKIIMQVR
jgi:RHS repeat-associated protein